MYIPSHFECADPNRLATIIHEHSFATVVTQSNGALFASHLPVLYFPERGKHGVLAAHVARANPQWRQFTPDHEALVIFQGPHGYISPSWYETTPAVPTWNYVAVHAYGVPRILSGEALEDLVRVTVEKYESALPNPWKANLPPEYRSKMINAIVGFEIEVSRIEGKFKLSQNRPPEDAAGAIEFLANSQDPTDRDLAQLMADEQNAKRLRRGT